MIWPTRRRIAFGSFVVLALLFVSPLSAQRRRDPLSQLEIDQLRDAMLDPDMRLRLYVTFSRDRMTALEQMRANPKTTDRGLQTHDLLQDFLTIYQELDDNIDMYVGRKNDVRKPLKLVIEADTEFQSKLRALKDAANADPKEAKQYEFVLSDSLETVDSSAEDHRKTLVEVEEYMKHKKKN
jgi:predicted lipid carrier protein YhbT